MERGVNAEDVLRSFGNLGALTKSKQDEVPYKTFNDDLVRDQKEQLL
jgi:hypothetical protein